MTFFVFGSECDVVLPSDSLTYETTASGVGAYGTIRDSVFTRTAISQLGAGYGEIDAGTNLTTFWFHMMYGGNGGGPVATLHDGSLVEAFRLNWNSGSLQMYYLSAPATWTAIGSPVTVTNYAQEEIDIKVVPGGSGSAELYVGGTRRASGSAAMTQFANLRYARVKPDTGQSYSSQFIIADEPTVGLRVLTCPATGVGDNNDGTGAYSDINEAVFNDANYVTLTANAQVKTFDHSTDFTGYDVLALGVAARLKCGATGPQNAQLVMDSSTNFVSSTKALNNGYSNIFAAWATDPNTSAAWAAANASATKYGLKGIT